VFTTPHGYRAHRVKFYYTGIAAIYLPSNKPRWFAWVFLGEGAKFACQNLFALLESEVGGSIFSKMAVKAESIGWF
jgi:hypothetical protein